MKGDAKVIHYLNAVLRNELTAINQYFLHSRMFQDWGLQGLAAYEHGESIDEMKHADGLIGRILFLEGLPNLQDIGKLMIGENPKEMLTCDLRLELDAIRCCARRSGIASRSATTSRETSSIILDSEEEHVDWIETQLDLIGKVGLENYLQSQMHKA